MSQRPRNISSSSGKIKRQCMKRAIRRRFVYVAVRIVSAVFFLLPLKIAVILGGKLGVLIFFLLAKHRLVTIENLKAAFRGQKTDNQIKKIAKQVFQNTGKSAAEFINLPKINSSNIDRLVKAQGLEKIDHALLAGNGAIVLSCHFGNWELSAAYFGLKGYTVSVVFRPSRDPRYDGIVNSVRRSKNINIIPRENSFKRIISILKSNQIVGILPDQDIDSIDGVFVNFFNKSAYTPTGPVALAMVTKSPMFFAFCIRENGTHKIVIEGPIELELTGDKEKDLLVNTQKWSDIAERYIRQYPEQWMWFHRRWKTQKHD
ncbi:MAG: hypothetical protein COY77_00895 [Candidatus Omnitrophica bacterium CG_4_10_14_0_8_um_filter_43_18]|nr:MAG: hypothetical protein COY77_00895 [Candidatus Omnitrophica bacterium CG_4_10_14_0_8_um_filter_43_18]PJC46633.1 MAG: hypothetical protein CO036_01660 [Candidatus Omnitrophica bacterium CG_4_9_14_0_2_um_filter_43_12]